MSEMIGESMATVERKGRRQDCLAEKMWRSDSKFKGEEKTKKMTK